MVTGNLVSEATIALRKWLESSNLVPGTRLPFERPLAQQLGLNHYALNRAMSCLIAEGLLVREGYRLIYSPRPQTAAPFSCDLVIHPQSDNLRSYRKVARELGINIKTHFWKCTEDAVKSLHLLDSPETESVVLEPAALRQALRWEPSLAKLIDHRIPAIIVGHYSKRIPCVLADKTRALQLTFSHLMELGHKEVALTTLPPLAPASAEIVNTWETLCRQNERLASQKRVFFHYSEKALREDTEELARRLTEDWSNVTAIVVNVFNEAIVQNLIEELDRRHRHVPKDLSLICLGEQNQYQSSPLPITMAAFDASLVHEAAFRMAQRMARKKETTGMLPPVGCIKIEPNLILKASTLPTASYVAATKTAGTEAAPVSFEVEPEGSPKKGIRDLESVRRRPYGFTSYVPESRFMAADLSGHVNRPLNYRRGWLGDLPLKHFYAGKHSIHGVPFQVLGGTKRSDCGAVVFRSTVNTKGQARELPTRLVIPIASKVLAIYFLHGCGHTKFLQPFATYGFYGGEEQLGLVRLVALGLTPPDFDAEALAKETLKPNIQDWWSDFSHVDFPHARRVPIAEGEEEDAASEHRYLYTLEWINPCPDIEISHVEILANSAQSTTLGLLAVTALKK